MAPHWTGLLIVALLVLVLFGGRGKISAIMGDFAKGVTAFRKGLRDDEGEETERKPGSLPGEAGSRPDAAREDERANS